ncbi:MAG: hypothetical protein E5Y16_37340, partial [Mesorhizobium sp.]
MRNTNWMPATSLGYIPLLWQWIGFAFRRGFRPLCGGTPFSRPVRHGRVTAQQIEKSSAHSQGTAMTIRRSTLNKLAFSTLLLTLPLNAAFAK